MMLHRHFEKEQSKEITTTADLSNKDEFVSEVFPPDDAPVETPKKRGRPKKTQE